MSKFVNFKKRDVALPTGCKDLIDVLKRHSEDGKRQSPVDDCETPTVVREEFGGWLQDGESLMRRFFEADSSPAFLFVTPADERAAFHIHRLTDGTMVGSVMVTAGSSEERAVRLFLENNGLEVQPDCGVPLSFVWHGPVQVFIDVRPIPMEPESAHALVLSLLRSTLRMTDETQVTVRWYGKE